MIKTIVTTPLPVDEEFTIKKNVITNGSSPKRVCIVTGTHGDELEGQFICFLLQRTILDNLHLLDGTVEVFPALNPLGIDSITRGIPNFDLDMNRIFPGSPDGSMAEQAAHAIVADLQGADMVIDLHSSNIFLREVPQARINVNNADALVPYARKLNLEFIWIHEAATVLESTLAHSLNSTGTPCIVVELGVGMRINHFYGKNTVLGLLNLLHTMGMWREKPEGLVNPEPIVSRGDEVAFINASHSGIFSTETHNSRIVHEGMEIGQIIDPLSGTIVESVKASATGFLFTIRAYPVCYEGSLLARIQTRNYIQSTQNCN